jgi:2-C-methyl-D-erythritol 4-phosphate cytidylyltransferase
MNVAVILPAAGLGTRFASAGGPQTPKIELDLDGRAVFLRAIDAFRKPCPGVQIAQIILAINPDGIEAFRFKWGDLCTFAGVIIVPGGTRERWETVRNALQHVEAGVTHVAIHDAARPLVTPTLIERVFTAAARFDAVIPGMPINCTLKRVAVFDDDQDRSVDPLASILGDNVAPKVQVQRVTDTVDRSGVIEVQTPQVFAVDLLRRAYASLTMDDPSRPPVTDDAMLVESLGEPVRVVEGEATNLKITRPADVQLAQAILAMNKPQAAAANARRELFGDDE